MIKIHYSALSHFVYQSAIDFRKGKTNKNSRPELLNYVELINYTVCKTSNLLVN